MEDMYCVKKKLIKANISSYETFGKAPPKSNREDTTSYLKVGFESDHITRRMQHSKFKYIIKHSKAKVNPFVIYSDTCLPVSSFQTQVP